MKNSKKILIVTSEFPPQPGGVGNHAFNLASQLSKNKYKVTVLADFRSKDGQEEKIYDRSLDFKVIRIKRYGILIFTYFNRWLVYRKYLKSTKPEIIIASGKFPLWLVAFESNFSNKKRLAVIHGSEVNLKVKWRHILVDRALKRFDTVIAVSGYTKSLVAHLKLKSLKVITNGFNHEDFKKKDNLPKIKGFPNLITVGSLNQRKGQHNVICKLPYLIGDYPDIHYHMVGIPSEKSKLLNLAKKLKVESHITFHGVLSQLKLTEMLSGSDIFVMLSENTDEGDVEGFGIAILEANFMGLPAIGSKGCGIEDAIDNYKTGILVTSDNLEEFKFALNEIIDNKGFYTKNAYDWALKNTWETIIKKYIKLIAK